MVIRVGDGRTIHSLGGVVVMWAMSRTQHCKVRETDAFDIVIGTYYLRRNPQI